MSTKWTLGHFIPSYGLSGWWSGDTAISGGSAPDMSGNGFNLAQASTPPALTTNVVNGLPAFYFDGSANPLVNGSAAISAKHAFAVCSYDGASFTGRNGLVCDTISNQFICGSAAAATTFRNTSLDNYRKDGLLFTPNFDAPVNNIISLTEFQAAAGSSLVGVQIGQNSSTSAKWKGYVAEVILYNRVLTSIEIATVYKYFAMKYAMYQKTAGGLDYFPFIQDWGSPVPTAKRVLMDESEDNTPTYRTKQSKKKIFDLTFTRRRQEEVDAVETFNDTHFPGTQFVFVDKSKIPNTETTVRYAIDNAFEPTPHGPTDFEYKQKFKEV